MRKLISLITLLSFSLQAATITDDKLTVGKKASASAKEIVFDTNDGAANKKLSVDKITKKLSATSDEVIVGDGTASDKALTFNRGGSNAQVKWNELTDKLQFSNDGTTFKDLGTGGGGGGSTGVNVLTNDSFEDAVGGVITDWSNTGGTLTQQTYTNSVDGDAKYFQFVATGAGQYFEMVKTVPTNFNGQGCQVDFKKLNIATADLFKVEALDGSNNVLASANVGVSSWQKFPTLSFACPSAGSTFKIRVTSLAAGTLQGDKAYLGSNQNIVNLSQAKKLGSVFTPQAANCRWIITSSSYVNFAPDTDCPAPTINGVLKAPLTKVPGVILPAGSQAGTYYFSATGAFYRDSTSAYGSFRFSDGASLNSKGGSSFLLSSSSPSIVGSIEVSSALSVDTTIQIQARTATGNTIISNDDNGIEGLNVEVYYFPAGQETAVNPEQSSWFIDANIGGANPSLGTSALSSYTEVSDANLDLVINTSKGSANAEIPCSAGFNSTGLTCSGASEHVGIAFIPPSAGIYEACFTVAPVASGAGGAATVWQVVETPNNALTILQEGGDKVTKAYVVGAVDITPSSDVCGTFKFSDTSKKTLRLMREQIVSGTPGHNLYADRAANQGQRDIKVKVRPLLSAYNRPILTGDQVTTKGVTNPEVFSFSFAANSSLNSDCSSGSCYVDQIGNLVNSFNFVSTGTYNLNVSKSYSKLKCSPGYISSTNQAIPQSINSCSNCNTLTMVAVQRAAGTVGNVFGTVICHGIP